MRNVLLIFSTLLLFACKDKNSDTSSSDYELNANGLTLVKWKNESTTSIDMQADPTLREVKIIGEQAFSKAQNLKSITLPTQLITIEKEAFLGIGIRNITIPSGVRVIRKDAFNATALTTVQFSEGLTDIEEGAFVGCQISLLNFPESLQSIGDRAFFNNKVMVEVTIPKNVQNIGARAFPSGLTTVTFKGMNPPKINEPFEKVTRIYVPKASLEAYKNSEYFKPYANVILAEE
ncbi:hypothetical protein RCZ04_03710 [Capnocytophaga sp. HP1101]